VCCSGDRDSGEDGVDGGGGELIAFTMVFGDDRCVLMNGGNAPSASCQKQQGDRWTIM
jgi:hypothetical protein